MSDETFYFVGSSLPELARDLRGAAASLATEAPPVLTEVGKMVEERAKQIASDNGSTSIPGTIVGGLVDRLTYRIQAGSSEVAIAALWELGNAGSKRDKPTFEHPVFGRWAKSQDAPSRNQARHPFLRPALTQQRAQVTKMMEAMWDQTLRDWRLDPTVAAFMMSGE